MEPRYLTQVREKQERLAAEWKDMLSKERSKDKNDESLYIPRGDELNAVTALLDKAKSAVDAGVVDSDVIALASLATPATPPAPKKPAKKPKK